MLMKEKNSHDLIQIEDLEALASPLDAQVRGRRQAGEEEQQSKLFEKRNLAFPSGEGLPKCWTDPAYQLQPSTASSH